MLRFPGVLLRMARAGQGGPERRRQRGGPRDGKGGLRRRAHVHHRSKVYLREVAFTCAWYIHAHDTPAKVWQVSRFLCFGMIDWNDSAVTQQSFAVPGLRVSRCAHPPPLVTHAVLCCCVILLYPPVSATRFFLSIQNQSRRRRGSRPGARG